MESAKNGATRQVGAKRSFDSFTTSGDEGIKDECDEGKSCVGKAPPKKRDEGRRTCCGDKEKDPRPSEDFSVVAGVYGNYAEEDPGDYDDDETKLDYPSGLEDLLCVECSETPCVMIKYRKHLSEYALNSFGVLGVYDLEGRSKARKGLYRHMASIQWGYLGRNIRKEHPTCVLAGIRSLYPSPNGKHMGHLNE